MRMLWSLVSKAADRSSRQRQDIFYNNNNNNNNNGFYVQSAQSRDARAAHRFNPLTGDVIGDE